MTQTPQRTTYLITHAVLFVVFLGLLACASIRFGPAITRVIGRPEQFKAFLDAYGPISALVYILFQVAHIIIIVIPGEFVQIGGGYAFGTALGTLYSTIGTVIGTVIVFGATRLFGYSLVRAVVSPGHLARFDFLINSPKSEITIFLLFLIPGFPKDALLYIAALTPVKPLPFILICTIARLPGLWGSAYIGANLQVKNYVPVWILSGVALVLFVVGMLAKDTIIDTLHHLRRPPKDATPGR